MHIPAESQCSWEPTSTARVRWLRGRLAAYQHQNAHGVEATTYRLSPCSTDWCPVCPTVVPPELFAQTSHTRTVITGIFVFSGELPHLE